MSMLEVELDPLRTSSTSVRAPTFTEIRAPMPSRFDFVPTVRTEIQGLGERTWFTSRLGGAFMLLITADILPSFQRSPTASPREEACAVIAGPASAEISANVPLPRLW